MDKTLPERKTVTVDGVTTEYTLCGDSGPTIVLLNGFRMPLSSWDKLYPEIQNHGRVFAYNRHGIGKSSKARCPQTGEEVIRSLENVLSALHLSPPYILIAHSFGGILANLYARLKPRDFLGMVFVEIGHPSEVQLQAKFKPPAVVRLLNDGVKAVERLFDKYKFSEDECVSETLRQLDAAGEFPNLPLKVITGTKKMPFVPEESFNIHLQQQKALLELSPNSTQYIADESGHFPQITQPEIVLTAIKDMCAQVIG